MKDKKLVLSITILVILLFLFNRNTVEYVEIINNSSGNIYKITEKKEVEKIEKIFNNAVKEGGISDLVYPSPLTIKICKGNNIEVINAYIYNDNDTIFFTYESDTNIS